ncbi:Ribonuclease P protein component [Candidatus Hepatincolaceae symbiont of Richtersius coronifer]
MQLNIIKKRPDFLRVCNQGKKIVCRNFLIFFLEENNLKDINLYFGFTVSSKVGNAVVRNKVKRRLKHAVRGILVDFNKTKLQNKLMICIIAKKQNNFVKFSQIEEDFAHAFKKYYR